MVYQHRRAVLDFDVDPPPQETLSSVDLLAVLVWQGLFQKPD
jgi:hypothetical protein